MTDSCVTKEKIIILGAGGHMKSVVDSIESMNCFEIAGIVDSNKMLSYKNYTVIGSDDDLKSLYDVGIRKAVLGIGFMGKVSIRNKLYTTLKTIGYELPVIIDSSAIIANDVEIDEGTFIGKKAVVNSQAHIGKMTIINTGSIIEHECIVGNFSHVSVGAVICGQSKIGENCMIGANSTIMQCCNVPDNTVIGAVSLVNKLIEESGTYIGSPARRIK